MRRLLPLALLAAACNTGFDPQYRVLDLRILAVRARVLVDPPPAFPSADVAPGDTVLLDALVANPLGRAAPVVRWFTCAPTGTDELPPCLDPELLKDPDALEGHPGVLALGTGNPPAPIPVQDVAGALDAVLQLALDEPTFQCRLYAEIPVVVVAESEGRREIAVKRVRLTPRPGDLAGTPLEGVYLLNLNPAVADVVRAPSDEEICAGGADVTQGPFPAARTVLCGRALSGSVGKLSVCGPEGKTEEIEETLSWQWFVTAGTFPEFDGIGNAVGDAVDFERPPGDFTLFAILRDGRGGEDWREIRVDALP